MSAIFHQETTRKRKRGAVLNEAVVRKIHTVLALIPELITGYLI